MSRPEHFVAVHFWKIYFGMLGALVLLWVLERNTR
jgi:hypothetical protein